MSLLLLALSALVAGTQALRNHTEFFSALQTEVTGSVDHYLQREYAELNKVISQEKWRNVKQATAFEPLATKVESARAHSIVQGVLRRKWFEEPLVMVPSLGMTAVIQDGRVLNAEILQSRFGDMDFEAVGNNLRIKVHSLAIEVKANFDLRLGLLYIKETGFVHGVLQGGGFGIDIPMEGTGTGRCRFDPQLDVKFKDITVDTPLVKPLIQEIMQSPTFAFMRREAVAGSLRGMCKALLENRPKTSSIPDMAGGMTLNLAIVCIIVLNVIIFGVMFLLGLLLTCKCCAWPTFLGRVEDDKSDSTRSTGSRGRAK